MRSRRRHRREPPDRLEELNDVYGRGILFELTDDSAPHRPYRAITRGMYRDQFYRGARYARAYLVPS